MSKKSEDPLRRQRKAEIRKMLQRLKPAGIDPADYGTNNKVQSLFEELGQSQPLDPSAPLPSDVELAEMLAASLKDRKSAVATGSSPASVEPLVSSTETEKPASPAAEATTAEEPSVEASQTEVLNPVEAEELDEIGGLTGDLEVDESHLEVPEEDEVSILELPDDDLASSQSPTSSSPSSPPSGGGSTGGIPPRQRPPARSPTPPGSPPRTPSRFPPSGGLPRRRRPRSQRQRLPNWAWLGIGASAALVLILLTVFVTTYVQSKKGEVVLSKKEHEKLKVDLVTAKKQADDAETELADAKTERETAKEQAEQATSDKEEAERLAILDRKLATNLSRDRTALQQQLEEHNVMREAERLERLGGRSMSDIQAADALVIAKRLGLTSADVQASSPTILEFVRRGIEQNQKIEDLKQEIEEMKAASSSIPPAAQPASPTPGSAPPSPPPLEAKITGPDQTKVGAEVTFEAKDSKGTIKVYHWKLGDGTELDGIGVKHTFAKDGTFTVTLIVEDDAGKRHEVATKQVKVEQP